MPDIDAKHHEAHAALCRQLGSGARHRTVFRALRQMEREYEEKARAARTFAFEAE